MWGERFQAYGQERVFYFFLRKKIKIKLKLGGKNVWKKINRIGQEPYN